MQIVEEIITKKISIGILLDELKFKSWQKNIITYIENHPFLKLEILIINNNESSKGTSRLVYRLFQAVDRKFFKVANDAFEIEDLKLNSNLRKMIINGVETKFSYRFSDDDINEIRKLNLDVLIRFGFGILKGEILNSSKYGVWSLHHGDNKINRGGPPGFWEVVNKEPITGVTLQRLTSDLDGGIIIDKSFTKTNLTSFNRNKNDVFWSGVELFNSALDNLVKGKLESMLSSNCNRKSFYSKPLYRDPSNSVAFRLHSYFWIRRIKENIVEFINPTQWFLIYKFKKQNEFETSIFRYKKLKPPKGYDWADPFVINYKNEGFYVFFEELYIKSRKGHISYFKFNMNGELVSKIPRKVLEEKHHLSYPFIFEKNSNLYMIPESASSGELWLYKCIDFPDKWEKHKIIFDNKSYYDATLIEYNEVFYLFGNEKVIDENSRDQYLFIYYSHDLFSGNWQSHPSNPIYRDVRRSRPAGKIFEHHGKLIRPSQIGAPKYGYGIQFNEIITLSPTEFKEIKLEQINPDWEKNLLATHTFNSVDGFSILDAQANINK